MRLSVPSANISSDPWRERSRAFPLSLPEACLWLAAAYIIPPYTGALLSGHGLTLPEHPDLGVQMTCRIGFTVIFVLYFMFARRGTLTDLGLSGRRLLPDIAWGFAACLVAGALYLTGAAIVYLATIWWYGDAEKFLGWVRGTPFKDDSWQYMLAVCLAYPILEEIWFRALMYPPMRLLLSWRVSVVFLAAIFATAHNSTFPVTQFIGGLAFAYAYEKRQTLIAPIMLHIAGNSALAMLGWALKEGVVRL